MTLPKISVVLPTYNRRSTLQRAVASVLAQDEPQWELIVVDDASTDDTRAYLATLTDPRIRAVALARNAGVSVARNRGLEAARAEIVAFLDSDDVYLQRLFYIGADSRSGARAAARGRQYNVQYRALPAVL